MELLPLRALNEYVYCPRLFHLEYVQGLFLESADTLEGSAQHERAEARRRKGRTSNTQIISDEGPVAATMEWPTLSRTLQLSDDALGLVGKLDAVEEIGNHFAPVESKHSKCPEDGRHFLVEGFELSPLAWPGDQVQLCGQGLLLRANGYPCNYGYLYYRGSKKRVKVDFTENLCEVVKKVIANIRAIAEGPMPPPLVDSPKCSRCSLVPVCLPDETNLLLHKIEEPRRIIPGRDDAGIIYVISQGGQVRLSGDSLLIQSPEGDENRVPMKDVAGVVLFGNVQVTTQALHHLMEFGRSVAYLTMAGRLIGTASGLTTKNVRLRQLQVKVFEDPSKVLLLARSIVTAKLTNQRTFLRRSGKVMEQALEELKQCAEGCNRAAHCDSVRGYEGMGAKIYFENFPSVVSNPELANAMKGRQRRPPKDPLNAMLSFAYTLLLRDMVAACAAVGFDPMIGFFHSIEPGRAALALDLMEPFRVLIADSVVVRAVNTGMITSKSFHLSPQFVVLTDAGRRAFLKAYEQRMDEMVTHPQFSYRLSYRRIIELEIRLLARYLEGELSEYKPLMTR